MEWQRPKTTRMYIHPPKSERMYTLWREGKLLFGEIEPDVRNYESFTSSGIWFTYNGDQLDFHNSEYIVRKDGIPTHGLKNKIGNIDLAIETFATPERRSVCYAKVTLTNSTEREQSEGFGFIIRTGKECELVFESPDVYASYGPDINVWKKMPNTWMLDGAILRDESRTVATDGDIDFKFDKATGMAESNITLAPGESKTVIFGYTIGEAANMNYDAEKARTLSFWEGELARINRLPEKISSAPEKLYTVKNLAIQIMQCFCHPVGEEFMLARQGGLQRQVWTYETMPVLESLSRIGDFNDYIDPIIDLYFSTFWIESGEIIPLGIHWAMATGNVLYSFAKHSDVRGKEYFTKYRDKALKSFEWIKETRASTVESDSLAPGLFPPMSGCDDQLVFQSWHNTDSFNILALDTFAATLEKFSDPRAAEVRAEHKDYVASAKREWDRIVSEAADSDELDFPPSPRGNIEEIRKKFVFNSCVNSTAFDMSPEDVMKVFRYRQRRNIIKGGLYNRMPDKRRDGSTRFNLDENGKCIVWYVCGQEYDWFSYFINHGMLDKCEEILADNEKFAMSDEHYMLERYNQCDPWFAPWMPNASANGRTINMMLDYYG